MLVLLFWLYGHYSMNWGKAFYPLFPLLIPPIKQHIYHTYNIIYTQVIKIFTSIFMSTPTADSFDFILKNFTVALANTIHIIPKFCYLHIIPLYRLNVHLFHCLRTLYSYKVIQYPQCIIQKSESNCLCRLYCLSPPPTLWNIIPLSMELTVLTSLR